MSCFCFWSLLPYGFFFRSFFRWCVSFLYCVSVAFLHCSLLFLLLQYCFVFLAWVLAQTHQVTNLWESKDDSWLFSVFETVSDMGQVLVELEQVQGKGEIGIHVPEEINATNEAAWDDVAGRESDRDLVLEARRLEIEYYRQHEVNEKVPISECIQKARKAPLGIRWLDVDKGDETNPELGYFLFRLHAWWYFCSCCCIVSLCFCCASLL